MSLYFLLPPDKCRDMVQHPCMCGPQPDFVLLYDNLLPYILYHPYILTIFVEIFIVLFLLIPVQFKWFGWVELLQTHGIFSYNLCSFNYSVIQAVRLGWTAQKSWKVLQWSLSIQVLDSSSSLAGLNYPKLMKYSPTILVFSITRQFGLLHHPYNHGTLS